MATEAESEPSAAAASVVPLANWTDSLWWQATRQRHNSRLFSATAPPVEQQRFVLCEKTFEGFLSETSKRRQWLHLQTTASKTGATMFSRLFL